jgi:hypothetical protein
VFYVSPVSVINYEPVNYRIGRNPFRQNFFANSVTRDGGNTIVFFHSGSHFLAMMFDHLSLSFEQMEWASCEYYAHHGKMMPDDWREQLQGAARESLQAELLCQFRHPGWRQYDSFFSFRFSLFSASSRWSGQAANIMPITAR